MTKRADWILVSGTAFLLTCSVDVTASPENPLIRVQVYGEHKGTDIVYHYSVMNVSARPFNNFIVGSAFNEEIQDSVPQLGVLPTGYDFGPEGEAGITIVLDLASTTQPVDWEPNMMGSGLFSLVWRIAWESPLPGVQPGDAISGFSVTVPNIKDRSIFPHLPPDYLKYYYKGGFEVGFYPGPNYFGQIENMDVTAPQLSLHLSVDTLWPPNNKPVPITATITVKDDYDGEPEIKLESITANEPLDADDIADAQFGTDDRQFQLTAKRSGNNGKGRIYTVTYSATDASGNKATANATVVVPHDQGNQ